ncbi:putative toxin-antitoxin system toxin component, PIN family [soil metagenome]
MRKISRFVFDTNVLVSASISPSSPPGKALDKALEIDLVLMSEEAFVETAEVLAKPKFRRYFSEQTVQHFLEQLREAVVWQATPPPVTACRDPNDDKFLSLALSGQASCLISGDEDLLVLHPFQNIPILSPAAFLHTLK